MGMSEDTRAPTPRPPLALVPAPAGPLDEEGLIAQVCETTTPLGLSVKSQTSDIISVRPATEQDLVDLHIYGKAERTEYVKNIKAKHHTIARLLAIGKTQTEVAALVGESCSHLSTLVNHSEAFQELLAWYLDQADQYTYDMRERIECIASEGLDRLHEILREPDGLSPNFVRKATMDLLHFAGMEPVQKHAVAHFGASQETIKQIRAEVDNSEVLDAELVES